MQNPNNPTIPVNQMKLPGFPPPLLNEEFEIKIGALLKVLTGEVSTLKKCWQLSQQFQGADAQYSLDTLVTGELTLLELSATANRIMSMCDQLKTLTCISIAYYQTLRNSDDFTSETVVMMLDQIQDLMDSDGLYP